MDKKAGPRAGQAAAGLALLALAACQPGLTPVPRPTPVILAAQVTPALQSLQGLYRACADEQPDTGLVLHEVPASQINLAVSPLALRWGAGPAPEGYAAVIGQEELAVIVAAGSPLNQISLSDLRAIYRGEMQAWKEPAPAGEIQAWAYPKGDDAELVFESAVLDGQTVGTRVASLAPTPQAMIEAVAGAQGAIGFVPRRWVSPDGTAAGVKMIQVEGLAADLARQPLLAISKTEPVGPERAWLICLQDQLE